MNPVYSITTQSNNRKFPVGYTTAYRFGFNGQEKDDEVSGAGNTMTAEYWEYDARLGRRWNVDPIVKAHESPYAAFANNPIYLVDISGKDTTHYIFSPVDEKTGKPAFSAEQMENYRLETQKVYNENGINVVVKTIDAEQAKVQKLDRTDAMVMVTPWGIVHGQSTFSQMDRSNGSWDQSYVNVKMAEHYMEIIKKNGGKTTLNSLIGYLIAHEGWHQFLERANWDINHTSSGGGFQAGHFNSYPNLNMDGDEVAKALQKPTLEVMSQLRKTNNYQTVLVKKFFELHLRKTLPIIGISNYSSK